MTVKEIVKKYLKENGYDGLCNQDAGCGCSIDEICPYEIGLLCEPAYKIPVEKLTGEAREFAEAEELDFVYRPAEEE
ncbi:MAG: hypothetical protein ACOC80_13070 [Petrotogales bacterium]